jgi:hypothetical protein
VADQLGLDALMPAPAPGKVKRQTTARKYQEWKEPTIMDRLAELKAEERAKARREG